MTTRWLAFERRWRDHLCAAIMPRVGTSSLPGMGELDASESWHRLISSAPFGFRASTRVAVWALTLSPPFLLGKPHLFGHLSADEQDLVLVRSFASRWRTMRLLTATLRLGVLLCYFTDPLAGWLVRTGSRA